MSRGREGDEEDEDPKLQLAVERFDIRVSLVDYNLRVNKRLPIEPVEEAKK